MPSIVRLEPNGVWWCLRDGVYVVNNERSLKICEGRDVSTTRKCGFGIGDFIFGGNLGLR